ncbi:MAG: ABC transporter permease [Erysipelotrichaceae bacterium]|nr:ABC transporter permease [Erysipelotrichaceae bacterium]
MNEIMDIILTSLQVSLSSTMFAAVFAVPFGLFLGLSTNKAALRLRPVFSSLAGLPPVLAGITVFLLLSNAGPLGSFRLLYSKPAIVTAQVLIVFPLIVASVYPLVLPIKAVFLETCFGLNIPKKKQIRYLFSELRYGLLAAVLLGFGRAMAEVGAVMMVGGNIRYKTRVMTTAIVLETNQGNYSTALTLGIALLLISFSINWLVHGLFKEVSHDPLY